MRASLLAFVTLLVLGGCLGEASPDEVMSAESNLTSAQRRVRAGEIRDAASSHGMTQGYLLAGIADAETSMSQCWSELTWACQGPYSSECGGPVVAGAGDGPCSLQQGGLGMFQFDSGTYSQTLASHGTGILTVAGNTAAAVDFVVNMVINSIHISNVSTRDQAIAWMNDVRINNGQWDAWITTVTHYYNGCPPGASCFSQRYASYANHTIDVYNEMGATFWNTSTYGAAFVAQSFPYASASFDVVAGQEVRGYLEMRNTGTQTWTPGHTFLGTTEPRDVASPIRGSDWVSANRAATIDSVVAPGGTGRFNFSVRAPVTPGTYDQFFNLVEEGVTWFSDSGGPIDHQIEIRLTSTPAPTPSCPTGIGASWTCMGSDRVQCVAGVVTRDACAYGCTAGACNPPPPPDAGPPPVHAGDAGMPMPTSDAGMFARGDAAAPMPMPMGSHPHTLSGGCSASPGRGAGLPLLAVVALALLARRRITR
jgi:hypothetical protein